MTNAKDRLSPPTIRMINSILESILFENHTEELMNYVTITIKKTLKFFEDGLWIVRCSVPRKDGIFKVFINNLEDESGDGIIFTVSGYTINDLIGLQKLDACVEETPDRDSQAKFFVTLVYLAEL